MEQRLGIILGGMGALAALGAALIGLGIPALHALRWLKDGYWPEYKTLAFFDDAGWQVPMTSWLGVQKGIYWVMDQPFAVVGAATLVVLAMLLISKGDQMIESARRKDLEKTERGKAS